jgi:hypothetical protein
MDDSRQTRYMAIRAVVKELCLYTAQTDFCLYFFDLFHRKTAPEVKATGIKWHELMPAFEYVE